MKTVLIFNGSCKKGQEIIEKLLSENDLTNNIINNEVICVDKPENADVLQKFLAFNQFMFISAENGYPIDLDKKIDTVLIAVDERNRI